MRGEREGQVPGKQVGGLRSPGVSASCPRRICQNRGQRQNRLFGRSVPRPLDANSADMLSRSTRVLEKRFQTEPSLYNLVDYGTSTALNFDRGTVCPASTSASRPIDRFAMS